MDKEELLANVKEWLNLDTEIKEIQGHLKLKKATKTLLSAKILNVMKSSNADSLNCSEGSLKYVQNKIKKPINDKKLDFLLKQYFKTEEEAEGVKKYILENRDVEIKDVVKKK